MLHVGDVIVLNTEQVYTAGHTSIVPRPGRYVVTRARMEGGSHGHDPYPDGWHVNCTLLEDQAVEVNFYQSGCFTVMHPDIKVVGRAAHPPIVWKEVP